VLCGGVLAPILLMNGLRSVLAETASLLLNLEIVLTALLAWWFFHENAGRRVVAGMLAILAGAIVLVIPGRKTEIVLGHRGHDEIYGYERNIRNRIRRFVPIWDHYASEAGYDLSRIRADLEELGSIAVYAGKYRALEPIQPYTRVEVQAGPGPLAKYVQERRKSSKPS